MNKPRNVSRPIKGVPATPVVMDWHAISTHCTQLEGTETQTTHVVTLDLLQTTPEDVYGALKAIHELSHEFVVTGKQPKVSFRSQMLSWFGLAHNLLLAAIAGCNLVPRMVAGRDGAARLRSGGLQVLDVEDDAIPEVLRPLIDSTGLPPVPEAENSDEPRRFSVSFLPDQYSALVNLQARWELSSRNQTIVNAVIDADRITTHLIGQGGVGEVYVITPDQRLMRILLSNEKP
jgi:hypothetical protein